MFVHSALHLIFSFPFDRLFPKYELTSSFLTNLVLVIRPISVLFETKYFLRFFSGYWLVFINRRLPSAHAHCGPASPCLIQSTRFVTNFIHRFLDSNFSRCALGLKCLLWSPSSIHALSFTLPVSLIYCLVFYSHFIFVSSFWLSALTDLFGLFLFQSFLFLVGSEISRVYCDLQLSLISAFISLDYFLSIALTVALSPCNLLFSFLLYFLSSSLVKILHLCQFYFFHPFSLCRDCKTIDNWQGNLFFNLFLENHLNLVSRSTELLHLPFQFSLHFVRDFVFILSRHAIVCLCHCFMRIVFPFEYICRSWLSFAPPWPTFSAHFLDCLSQLFVLYS